MKIVQLILIIIFHLGQRSIEPDHISFSEETDLPTIPTRNTSISPLPTFHPYVPSSPTNNSSISPLPTSYSSVLPSPTTNPSMSLLPTSYPSVLPSPTTIPSISPLPNSNPSFPPTNLTISSPHPTSHTCTPTTTTPARSGIATALAASEVITATRNASRQTTATAASGTAHATVTCRTAPKAARPKPLLRKHLVEKPPLKWLLD